MSKNRIIPQMFDIRPVDNAGDLDWEKIQKIERVLHLKKIEENFLVEEKSNKEILKNSRNLNQFDFNGKEEDREYSFERSELEATFRKKEELEDRVKKLEDALLKRNEQYIQEQDEINKKRQILEKEKINRERLAEKEREEKKLSKIAKKIQRAKQKRVKRFLKINHPGYFGIKQLFFQGHSLFSFDFKKVGYSFAAVVALSVVSIGAISFFYKGMEIRGKVLGVSHEGYVNLASAVSDISNQDFESSREKFSKAQEYFSESSAEMDRMGVIINDSSRFLPYISKASSGKNMIEAAKHLAAAGSSINRMASVFSDFKQSVDKGAEASFLEIFRDIKNDIDYSSEELENAQKNISKVKIDDLPVDMRDKFLILKNKLPDVIEYLNMFSKNSNIFTDVFGGNGPRKYLFLFQNNNEMRATGGFIGSYGLLDITGGHIRNFFIDGIFDPDGQLKDKIVPPKPIQKISSAWSLHDSNWFPDFPVSAKEAIVFYEKTGGPTVDGVITFTPEVMKKLLEITGPIEMKQYDLVLNSENFVEKTQCEVEENYKDESNPKKILSDLAPIVLDRIINSKDAITISKAAKIMLDSLDEKHILIYSENKELQKIISDQGWSGEILDSRKDYISVINTNINGYKTDGVIDEKIEHEAQIQSDGSIVDTVTITRKHNGGNTSYEWWNKVNADYMRVYVPKGSKLLDVFGQTREINESSLDYDKLGFQKDKLVQQEEDSMIIDEESGTRIYEDAGKTVFANWVYVSPQETVVVKYKYLLPFRLFYPMFNNGGDKPDSYSLVVQKQSGSVGSDFKSNVAYPDSFNLKWKSEDYLDSQNNLSFDTKISVDKFMGAVFEKKE